MESSNENIYLYTLYQLYIRMINFSYGLVDVRNITIINRLT